MTIGKRLFNLARSELNSLLDRAAEAEQMTGHDPDEDLYRRYSLDELSDAELEAEIERRHRARQAKAQEARQASKTASSSGHASASPPSRPAPDEELRRAFAALEVPFGADFQTVRKSYRALMRKYHPDRHQGSPEKQKAATELAQKLTLAYDLIEKRSRK
jgi:DnaJ-domain-containing protein 1